MKIQVIPADGFQVKDHQGKAIPQDGAQVDLSPVIKARLREGLLIRIDDDEADGSGDGGRATTGDGDDDETIDLDSLTKEKLKALLSEHEVAFDAKANKADLIAVAKEHFESAE